MKINNIILVLRTRIILPSSFAIYFFCICNSGIFPIVFPSLHISYLVSDSCGDLSSIVLSCVIFYNLRNEDLTKEFSTWKLLFI